LGNGNIALGKFKPSLKEMVKSQGTFLWKETPSKGNFKDLTTN